MDCPDKTDTRKHALFNNALVYEDRLPMRWQPISWPAKSHYLDAVNRENELLLQVLLSRDEVLTDQEEDVTESKSELKHLDTKINLLLNWVGNLMLQATPLPESQRIKISAFGIAFSSTIFLKAGDYLLVECFPDRHYPQAIKLFVQVLERRDDDNRVGENGVAENRAGEHSVGEHSAGENGVGTNANVVAEYVGVSDHVQDLISKYIFRHHRRCIAQQKRMKHKDV